MTIAWVSLSLLYIVMKTAIKTILWVVLVPVALVLLLAVLIYLPPVQQWAAESVASYVSRTTGMTARVGKVRLRFPLDLQLDSFLLVKKPPTGSLQPGDTIADLESLVADVSLLPLLKSQVEVNSLELNNGKVNTQDLIASVAISGRVGRLYVVSRGIDLRREHVTVDRAQIDNSLIDVALRDSVPPDTTESKADWKIDLRQVSARNTQFALHLPGDSMTVKTDFARLRVDDTRLLLRDGHYSVAAVDWQGGSLAYDRPYAKPQRGFDGNHIHLTDLHLRADSFYFAAPNLSLAIREASFAEQSGLTAKHLTTHFAMDDKRLHLPDLDLTTTRSRAKADFEMELNAFADHNPGRFYVTVDGAFGLGDIQRFVTDLPRPVVAHWPNRQLAVKGRAEGNLQYLTLRDLNAELPTVARLSGSGFIANLTEPSRMRANLRLKGRSDNLQMVASMMPADVAKQVNLPRGIDIDGTFKVNGSTYDADFLMAHGGGTVRALANIDTRTMAYRLTAKARNLQLQHFLPTMGVGPFSGEISLNGRGTDPFSPSTGITLNTRIDRFSYAGYTLDGLGGDITLGKGHIHARINSTNPMLGGRFTVDGTLSEKLVDVHLKGLLSHIDLRRLGIIDRNYTVSTDADLHLRSDMKQSHSVSGHVGDFFLHENIGSQRKLLAQGDFDIDFAMRPKAMNAHFDGMMRKVDFHGMGLADNPFMASFGANLLVESNLDDYYRAEGKLCNLAVSEKDRSYRPGDLDLDVLTRRDTTHAAVQSGDLALDLSTSGGYKQLLGQTDRLTSTLQKQIANKLIDQRQLWQHLPNGHLSLRTGANNLLATMLRQMGCSFGKAQMDFTFSPQTGLNGTGQIGSLVVTDDSIRLDSVALTLNSDDDKLRYKLRVANNARNAYPITANLDGSLYEKGLLANLDVADAAGKTALDLGMSAALEERGRRIKVVSDKAVLGYKTFDVNPDNYVFIGDDNRVSGQMKLIAADGAGLHIYTDDEDMTSLQNVTLSVNRFELGELTSVIPFAPRVSGLLDGDFHLIQAEHSMTVSSDMTVRNMIYEGNKMGNVGMQLVYIPRSDGSHYVDALIMKDDIEVGTLTGVYKSEGEGHLDGHFDMTKFPLSYINGFVPDRIVGLRGTGDGKLSVSGPLSKLDIDGKLMLDSAYIFSEPYGVEMRFADKPLTITDSKVLFDEFVLYANNGSPMKITGNLDFSNMDRMTMNMTMRARDFLLIDAKENIRSQAYGKAYVNFFARMQGPLSELNMRGRLDVLGKTDMTYVLRESALVTDNQMDELVKFVDLNDSTANTVVARPDISGFKMDLSLNIDEAAHIVCALNADHSNYIDLIGGGTLRMSYDPTNSVQMQGRYTLNSGEMKYALPVIPLRTFNIQRGSYIEFTGDVMDPRLNITAMESLRANVADGTSSGKIVTFNCGVNITETLSKPQIQFIIEAPEDMQVQNELNTKSIEERGKLAVSMLASGMYLDESTATANSAMNGALASFMQSEINNITGNALRSMGLDLSANMESATDATGALHTDYTFKFSKRLWNNRLRIIMGGRVSTGSSVEQSNGAFFDNFSMEYRLNSRETQYLKLFYERDSYDWLEGNVSEYGAGFMWRRKLSRLIDIFNFKSSSQQQYAPRPIQGDSAAAQRADSSRHQQPSAAPVRQETHTNR